MANRTQSAGITLVELLVAVGIVAILAAIAYPSYQRHVARTHRNAASACLSQYAQFMERYYTSNLRYVDEDGDAPAPDLPCSRENNMEQRYAIALAAGSVTERAYTLEAVPTDMQAAADLQCGTLSVDQTGARSVTGAAGVDVCWR